MDTTILPVMSKDVEDAVFDAAESLQGADREILLETFFHRNPQGLARVRRMLEQSGTASTFFLEISEHNSVLAEEVLRSKRDEPSAREFPEEEELEKPGSMVGPYKILSRIGGGGSGVVYEAEQQSPVKRIVALKVLRPGMDTASVVARFKLECQTLAAMDHPNIARVYDAGATAKGRSYFVMERVSGDRITSVCDRERLGIVERIHLFIQICHGIQHAHQKGVIHRDINPSNILVAKQDGVHVPKVIDFGIAKATAPSELADRSLRTLHDQMIGTPPYMSPEQVEMNGIDVDTRADIYSLGALLYELLGGRPPFDGEALARAGISEMRRVLIEDDPPRVSRMLAALPGGERAQIAESRGEDPDRIVAHLQSDIDWIVVRAMEKDRNRRYETVNALAADLRRYLSHEPVQARRPGRLYLLEKFVRRNRLACGFGAAVAISLIGGLVASTTMYYREREALAEQERQSRRAEAAGAREAALHKQIQARANVSLAAVLLTEGRVEEADALLRESPPESIEPSREAAGVLRALGEWNAIYGRWPQAFKCFLLLDQANQLDDPVTIIENMDLLQIAPALLKGGGPEIYETFRRRTMDRHLPVTNAVQAEHLLKVCLLTPASGEILRLLTPAADVCRQGISKEGRRRSPEWEAFSMALFSFRQGNLPLTLEWARKTNSYGDPAGARVASALCLTAMTHARSGDASKASKDLSEARKRIEKGARFGPGWREVTLGTWHSWAVAQILLAEAEREIGGGSRPPAFRQTSERH